jgi:hypothetical protein
MTCSRAGRLALMTAPAPSTPIADQFPKLFAVLVLSSGTGKTLWSHPNVALGQNRVLGTITRLALSEDRLYVGTGDSAYVDAYDLTGRLMATFQVAEAAPAPSRAQYERAVDQMLNLLPGAPDARREARERLLQVPMPDRLPPYSGLIVDPLGILWVVTSPPGEPSTEIRAITGDGKPIGTVRLPVTLQVLEIGEGYLLGTAQTEESQSLVTYPLRRIGSNAQR